MNKYVVKKTVKTRFLNLFRSFFIIPLFEKILFFPVVKKRNNNYRKLLPPVYLYRHNTLRKVIRNGLRFNLDISNMVDYHLYYDLNEPYSKSIENDIKSAAVIFDIGANIGSTALYFGKINPDAKIFAFEPHKVSFGKAVENIRLNNHLENIAIYNIGLGSSDTEQKLYEVHPNNPGMNRILKTGNYSYTEIHIETLDRFVAVNNIQAIDFIKIDVEGYEHEVLKGGILTIKKNHPVLLLELDDNYLKENNSSAKELILFLHYLGYNKIYKTVDGEHISEYTPLENCHVDVIAKK